MSVNPRKWRELARLYEKHYREMSPADSEMEQFDNTILNEKDKLELLRLADDELFKQLDRDRIRLGHIFFDILPEFSLKEKIWDFVPPDLKLFNDPEALRKCPKNSVWSNRLVMAAIWEKCNERREYFMPNRKLLGVSRAVIDCVYHDESLVHPPVGRKFAERMGWSYRQFENIRPRLQLEFVTQRQWDALEAERKLRWKTS